MTADGSWGWGTSPDEVKGREDDREAAIEAAREAAEEGATVYVWSSLRDVDPAKYVPNAVRIVEAMGDRAYDNQPESMQDECWPDASPEAMAELETLLETIRAWARKHAKSWWVAEGEPEAVPPSIAVWHHVCARCAEGREHKPIGGLSRDGACAECGVAIHIPHSSYLVSAAKNAAPGGAS